MKIKRELRCVHRHTIKEHPSCFVKEMINYKSEKEFIKNTGKNWWEYPGNRIGFLDIETDGLKSDFSTMLSWTIKDRNGIYYYDIINKRDLFELEDYADKKLVESLVNRLSDFKIIITYFGLGFDLPYIRTKAIHYNIPFPDYGNIYSFDLYYTVRSKLNLSRKSLENVCDYFDIDGKTEIKKSIWRKAKYGNPDALEKVLEHNMHDCDITEQLYDKLITQSKWIRRSI